jgi:hypothetical protein
MSRRDVLGESSALGVDSSTVRISVSLRAAQSKYLVPAW